MILQRYLTKEIVQTTLAVLVFLVLLVVGGRLIKYFGIAAQGGMDVSVLFKLVGFQLPYLMEYMLPLSFFVALMLVLGRLYVDHEMDIVRASGLSPRGIGLMLIPLVVVLFVVQAGISLWAKPLGLHSAEQLKAEQAIRTAFDLIRPGKFVTANEYSLYVGALSNDKRELLDVMFIKRAPTQPTATSHRSTQRTPPRDTIIMAQRAILVDANRNSSADDQQTMLDLYEGRRYEIGENNLSYNQVTFSQYRLTLETPETTENTGIKLEAQPTAHLFQQLPNQLALAELGYRASLPFVMFIALILAIPLSKVSPRQGRWIKLLPSILLFATSVVAVMSLKSTVAKGKAPVWIYLMVMMVYVIFALYVYNKNKVHRRVSHVMTDVTQSRGRKS